MFIRRKFIVATIVVGHRSLCICYGAECFARSTPNSGVWCVLMIRMHLFNGWISVWVFQLLASNAAASTRTVTVRQLCLAWRKWSWLDNGYHFTYCLVFKGITLGVSTNYWHCLEYWKKFNAYREIYPQKKKILVAMKLKFERCLSSKMLDVELQDSICVSDSIW